MAGAAQLLLLCCLLQVHEKNLDDTCVAIWKTGSTRGPNVFNSGRTGQSENTLQGSLLGNLLAKDCTTVFHNMLPKNGGKYFFRLECGILKFIVDENTQITITDSLPEPVITATPAEVEVGAAGRLECSAVAPCPLLPPALTWTPAIGDVERNQQTASVTSVMNFTASRLHNGQRLRCSALYSRQAGNTDLQYGKDLSLRVLYPPNNTSVSHSGPVTEGTTVNLTCNTDANPPVHKFTWYQVDGDRVAAVAFQAWLSTNVSEADSRFFCQVGNGYGSQNSSIAQIDVQFPPRGTTVIVQPDGAIPEGVFVSLLCKSRANPPVTHYTWYKDDDEVESSGSSLTIHAVQRRNSGHYLCTASNELGEGQSAATQLDVQYSSGLHSLSLLICSLVGATGTLLVCGLMLLFFFRKGKLGLSTKMGSQDTSNAVVADGTNSSEVNVIYDNIAILESREESVHYASVDFVKLNQGSGVQVGEEEIRGLASKTSEYAVVRLSLRGSNGRRTMQDETEADAHLGEGMLS
ncbi:myelin-associated glycoprotein-like isoform 2-T3 [Spinachia spinachia]